MKYTILYVFSFSLFLLLSGCSLDIKPAGFQQLQDQITALSVKTDKMNKKILQVEKNQKNYQVTNQSDLMAVSGKIEGEINDTKSGFSQSLNGLNNKIGSLSKTQYNNDVKYNQKLDTFGKSYNDTLATLNSFNSTMLMYQNNLMSLKDSVQQITQNMNVLNTQQADLSNEVKGIKGEFNDKLQVMLSQLTNQESQIVFLEDKLNNISAVKPSEKKVSAPGGKSRIYTVYTVKQGDTLLGIANKFNVSLGKLMKLNKFTSNSTIFPGQKIIIP
ncbi:MAG: LysM peptidoglycan-binding domain-containing protein [Candidatus Omnitrophica bacterium]|nr:LysM peptidoglycan-binding domain-containing protein [Candidatus Omnitrophota bacterium]